MPKQPSYIDSSPLAQLCARYKITLARLAELCGTTSRTNALRLLRNELVESSRDKMTSRLAETLPDHLLSIGLSKSEVDEQLLEIFSATAARVPA